MRIHRSCRGSTMVEFTLVAIPLIFVLISVFEVSRAMWIYDTVAHAVRKGNRFAVVHGNNCGTHPECRTTVAGVADVIRHHGVGLIPSELRDIRFISSTQTLTYPSLAACLAATGTRWPPADAGGNRGAPVEIRAVYRFPSAIGLFWPGAGRGMSFGTLGLPASSRERIQF